MQDLLHLSFEALFTILQRSTMQHTNKIKYEMRTRATAPEHNTRVHSESAVKVVTSKQKQTKCFSSR